MTRAPAGSVPLDMAQRLSRLLPVPTLRNAEVSRVFLLPELCAAVIGVLFGGRNFWADGVGEPTRPIAPAEWDERSPSKKPWPFVLWRWITRHHCLSVMDRAVGSGLRAPPAYRISGFRRKRCMRIALHLGCNLVIRTTMCHREGLARTHGLNVERPSASRFTSKRYERVRTRRSRCSC